MRSQELVTEKWSQKYKSSINCAHPRGFSQKAHCAGKRKHNESIEMEMTCPDCGMCQTHGDHSHDTLDEACWDTHKQVGMKKKGNRMVPDCRPKESVAEEQHSCPHCGGEMVSEELMNEKQDACYYKVKSRYKVWPSAYASGALVRCRKKGAKNWGNKSESTLEERLEENLRDWFSDKWVRFGPDGKIRGDCARGDSSEGKPKCLPQSKAHSLGKKGRASAASRKRRQDPNAERSGKAINVNTKKKSNEGMDDPWGDQGNFAGDKPVNIGGDTVKQLRVGDIVTYFGQRAKIEAMSKTGNTSRITIANNMGGTTQDVLTRDLKRTGVAEASRGNYHANTTGFARGTRDDERHDMDQERAQIEKSGTWYIRLNGKLIRDKQGNPYSFRGKAAANKAAVTMQAKLFNQGKEFVLTTNPNDPQPGVAEQKKNSKTSTLTKKPQPYNDPNWAKDLPKEKLDALAGPKYKKDLAEAVTDNYLYHATQPGGMMRILRTGVIKAGDRSQAATKAKTQYPTISTTRSKQYAESEDFVDFLNLTREGNSVIIVLDRPKIANHYKMFSTSQGTQTVGDEYEEVIVAPAGSMPIQGTIKGFYFNPKRTAEIEEFKDVPWFQELLNSPYYMGPKQSVAEAFDKPYPLLRWEKGDYGDVDAIARLDDGTFLSIMFNKGFSKGTKEEAWSVEFYRNNSQEVTGEGDAQRVFATVLSAIQTFIEKYKPNKIIFSASKEVDPGQNTESRARLYDSLVQRYAKSWGFRAFRADTGNKVIYELSRKQPVAETINTDILNKRFRHRQVIGDYTYTASVEMFIGEPLLDIKAYDRDREIGHIVFEIIHWDDAPAKSHIESGGTEVDPAYRNKGVASTMYAYAKMLGNDIRASTNQTSQGQAMWAAWNKAGDAKHLAAEGQEKFNTDLMKPGFRWSQDINGITYLVRTQWNNMPEVIARVNNREVGRATFIDHHTRSGLESVSTYVSPKWQGHGIAKNMYAVMRMLGANIQPSATQTAMGKDMWDKWKKAGDTKHLTSMNAKLDPQS